MTSEVRRSAQIMVLDILRERATEMGDSEGWFFVPRGGLVDYVCVQLARRGIKVKKSYASTTLVPSLFGDHLLERKHAGRGFIKYRLAESANLSEESMLKAWLDSPRVMAIAINDFLKAMKIWLAEDEAQMNDGFSPPHPTLLQEIAPKSITTGLATVVAECVTATQMVLTITEDGLKRYKLMRVWIDDSEVARIKNFRLKNDRWPEASEWLPDEQELSLVYLAIERARVDALMRTIEKTADALGFTLSDVIHGFPPELLPEKWT